MLFYIYLVCIFYVMGLPKILLCSLNTISYHLVAFIKIYLISTLWFLAIKEGCLYHHPSRLRYSQV